MHILADALKRKKKSHQSLCIGHYAGVSCKCVRLNPRKIHSEAKLKIFVLTQIESRMNGVPASVTYSITLDVRKHVHSYREDPILKQTLHCAFCVDFWHDFFSFFFIGIYEGDWVGIRQVILFCTFVHVSMPFPQYRAVQNFVIYFWGTVLRLMGLGWTLALFSCGISVP